MTNELPANPQPASATLDCPSCGHLITYYDVTGSSYYGCPNCHAYFEYVDEGPPAIQMRFPKQAASGALPIGSEGYLHGQMHRVVGYLHRQEKGTTYTWMEYVLFRADGTYTQLAEYQGHWSYIEPISETYKQYGTGGRAFYVDTPERQYRLYNRYRPETLLAVGEFDWNVLDDEQLSVSEYIHPPHLLVSEHSDKRSDWYKGVYQTPTEVATAFGTTPADLPVPYGTGAIEPPFSTDKWDAVLAFTGMALVALFSLQLLFLVVKPRRVLLDTAYVTRIDTSSVNTANGLFKPVVTRSFTVDGPAALEIQLTADLDNQWVELPISLVNETSGQSYELTKVLEYYHGYEGGENWSEGSTKDEAELSRIPSGRYHLNLYPASEGKPGLSGTVRVTQNPTLLGNILVMMALLSIYPAYLFIRRQSMESSRWQNSDFSDLNES